MPANLHTRIYPTREELCAHAAEALYEVIRDAVAARGTSHIVLTGGGTGIGTLKALRAVIDSKTAAGDAVDLTGVHFWFGDERYLPADDPERNALQARQAVLDELVASGSLPAENIHEVLAGPGADTELPADQGLDEAAAQYAQLLAVHADNDPQPADGRVPFFDVVLLGMGDDAHVASLFPGLPGPQALGETVIAVRNSPKAPPERVSLTVEAINTTPRVWFLVAGAEKAEAVARARAAQEQNQADAEALPASLVAGTQESVWWLDEAAANS